MTAPADDQRSKPNIAAPARMAEAMAFGEAVRGGLSGDFWFREAPRPAIEYFDDDAQAAAEFLEIGVGDAGEYALWMYQGRTADNAPIVFMQGEGDCLIVIAENFDDFLRLLAVGAAEIGPAANGGDLTTADPPAPNLEKFRVWLKKKYNITPPEDPEDLVRKAQANHPDAFKWFMQWQKKHNG